MMPRGAVAAALLSVAPAIRFSAQGIQDILDTELVAEVGDTKARTASDTKATDTSLLELEASASPASTAGAATTGKAPGDDATREAASFQQYATAIHASADKVGRGDPGQTFNTQWFNDNCDLSEYDASGFDTSAYKLSEDVGADDKKWTANQKCAEQGHQMKSYLEKNFAGSRNDCAKMCWGKAASHKGTAVCCMHFADDKTCEARVGWQTLQESSWGTQWWKPWSWGRDKKVARLLYQEKTGADAAAAQEADEAGTAGQGQAHVENLVNEVNNLSMEGILNHLLSFYVCMRWYPDAEFVNMAKFEMGNTYVDEKTAPKTSEPVTRDDVIAKYLEAGVTPLRCTSNVNVQDISSIDSLIAQYKDPTSAIHELYTSVKQIHKDTQWSFLRWARFAERRSSRIARVNRALKWDASKPDQDSVQMADLRGRALFSKALQWPMLLRSSDTFNHHEYSPDNLFVLCFGPRVVSYPHKRPDGNHLVADVNMAGCNGMWNINDLQDHLVRIKKLFDPRLCFTSKLRRELQTQFLKTFVSMNQEFEQVLSGIYTKRVHELEPTEHWKFDLLLDNQTQYEEVAAVGASKASTKFTRVAGLLAKAHSKWILCPTKSTVSAAPFGQEDNFYRNPRAYEKWLGKMNEDNVPECKTLDPTTGCVKCVVAVKDEHGCAIRLNVTLNTLLQAVREDRFPFLKSNYRANVTKGINTETQKMEYEIKTKEGVCMVRKQSADMASSTFLTPQDADQVTRINIPPGALSALVDLPITGVNRYRISTRKSEKIVWDDSGQAMDQDTAFDPLGTNDVASLVHGRDSFAPRFVFTETINAQTGSNVPAHKVDYFMSCPCSKTNFAPHNHFQVFGSQGMGEYYNFR